MAQQQETRRKMAALINAASTGKLKATETQTCQPIMAAPEASANQSETTGKVRGALSNCQIVSNNAEEIIEIPSLLMLTTHIFSEIMTKTSA